MGLKPCNCPNRTQWFVALIFGFRFSQTSFLTLENFWSYRVTPFSPFIFFCRKHEFQKIYSCFASTHLSKIGLFCRFSLSLEWITANLDYILKFWRNVYTSDVFLLKKKMIELASTLPLAKKYEYSCRKNCSTVGRNLWLTLFFWCLLLREKILWRKDFIFWRKQKYQKLHHNLLVLLL